jgi:CheY-like chemotaxis protein
MKVVIVDDSIDNINLMKLYSKKSSEEFIYFTSPEESIEFIKENEVDLVFLDIQMPVLNGFEVLAELKKENSSNGPFICALTAFSSDKEIAKINSSDFDDFLQKPILRDQFLKYIETYDLKKVG